MPLALCRLTAILAIGLAAAPAAPSARTPGPPVATHVLLELFTSEGCESCPPADELLIQLVRTQPVAGVRIVGLSEHVDYWNKLGWVDPFSSVRFTNRQTAYATALHDDTYTPQAVIDGRFAVVGSSRTDVLAAIRKAAGLPKAAVELAWTPDLQITIPANPVAADGDVFVAITEDRLTSNVRRGENEGRVLNHDAVTRRVSSLGTTSRQGGFSRTVPIAPMLDPSWKRNELSVVVFVQSKGAVVALATSSIVFSPIPPPSRSIP